MAPSSMRKSNRRRTFAPGPQFLPVAEPDLSHLELRNLVDAYLSTWISSIGDYIRIFEQAWAARVGVAHGVATANGTVSLHLASLRLVSVKATRLSFPTSPSRPRPIL